MRLCAAVFTDSQRNPRQLRIGSGRSILTDTKGGAGRRSWNAEGRRPAALLRLQADNYDRSRAVARLRQYLPAGLVREVRVDGRSWDIED